jgi:hypothetical protein
MCVRFWNKCIKNTDSVAFEALLNDISNFKNGSKICWTSLFLNCIFKLYLYEQFSSIDLIREQHLDFFLNLSLNAEVLVKKYEAKLDTIFPPDVEDPRVLRSENISIIKYNAWIKCESQQHLKCPLSKVACRALYSLRLGFAKLRVNDHSINRSDRLCQLCRANCLEDEMHFLLDCSYFKHIRRSRMWSELYMCTLNLEAPRSRTMNIFMNQSNQYKLAHFLVFLNEVRNNKLNGIIDHSNLDDLNSDDES